MKHVPFKAGILVAFLVFSHGLYALGSREADGHRFSNKSLERILNGRGDVSVMAKALRDTGLYESMAELDGYTLFIPTNEAVEKMAPRLREAMIQRPDVLSQVIRDIMVKGVFSADELAGRTSVTTMGGITLEIEQKGRGLMVGGSDMARKDVFGDGFVVHIVSGIVVRDIRL
ncbi:MAG: fasciclin domain-containing protein [Spirochaetales bacterium]|nr:fasciclin domain-containing protein [Spirochaetales bacterium]